MLKMNPIEKRRFEHNRRYLGLQYLITQKRLTGEQPSNDLIKQTQEAGRLAGIFEDELNSF